MGLCHHRCHLIDIRVTRPPHTSRRQLVAVTIAVAFNDVGTSALINRAGTVAHHIRQTRRHMGLCHHRCHLSRHPRRKDRRTLPKRRAGCRPVAVALNDVLTAAIINRAETVAHAIRQTLRHGILCHHRCHLVDIRVTRTAALPRASSWLPSQSQSPSMMSAQPHS